MTGGALSAGQCFFLQRANVWVVPPSMGSCGWRS